MSQVKRQWCAMLAKLVAPMEPELAARAFVDMLPLLPADDSLYTRATLEATARCERRTTVPTYADISAVLGRAARERLPVAVRMGYTPCVPLLEVPRESLAVREACIARNRPAIEALRSGRKRDEAAAGVVEQCSQTGTPLCE